jgi:tRNA-Thr(GGU) m(6)t(6)A37 methyltransferase TsaA
MNAMTRKSLALQISPIGEVRSPFKTPVMQPGQTDMELNERLAKIRAHYRQVKETISELMIYERWAALLDGIEGFSHILVLYWPHLIDPERRKLEKVHPMGRKDLPEQGIFATRSPARPNPVLVSTVPLLARQGNVLKVKNLEALDGSPLIDIKPYVEIYHEAQNPRFPDWLHQIHRDLEGP